MEGEVTRLEAINERNPGQVSNCEHEAKTVGGDVHGSEEGGFIVEAVCDIPELESEDKPHGICDVLDTTTTNGLFASHADVDENPKDETGAEFVEGLEVKRANGGVELPSDEPLHFCEMSENAMPKGSIHHRWDYPSCLRGLEERPNGRKRHSNKQPGRWP